MAQSDREIALVTVHMCLRDRTRQCEDADMNEEMQAVRDMAWELAALSKRVASMEAMINQMYEAMSEIQEFVSEVKPLMPDYSNAVERNIGLG